MAHTTVVGAFEKRRDLDLELSLGNVENKVSIEKFGRSTNVDNGVGTDIWDRANATDDQIKWVAPTEARIHDITSSSTQDAVSGEGGKTLEVKGLQTWDSEETMEEVSMGGTTVVPTVNSYVIIHRMEMKLWGTSSTNVGDVTATAQADDSVTAQINAGQGQTQMAILGVPSVQDVVIESYYSSMNKSAGSPGSADVSLLVNTIPNIQLNSFVTKHTQALHTDGSTLFKHPFKRMEKFSGPAIIKIQADGDQANLDISAGFDLVLTDN